MPDDYGYEKAAHLWDSHSGGACYFIERSALSLPTVKRVESGRAQRVSDEARAKLQRALESAGVEFIDQNGGGPGVRLRKRHRAKASK